MEETVIVLMLKNPKTGFLEKELGCYKIKENEHLIYNIFAENDGGDTVVRMKLTVDSEIEDWQFPAVLDYYDTEVFGSQITEITEDDTDYNPVWEIVFGFIDDETAMEQKISGLLKTHKAELEDVFRAIEGLESEYSQ